MLGRFNNEDFPFLMNFISRSNLFPWNIIRLYGILSFYEPVKVPPACCISNNSTVFLLKLARVQSYIVTHYYCTAVGHKGEARNRGKYCVGFWKFSRRLQTKLVNNFTPKQLMEQMKYPSHPSPFFPTPPAPWSRTEQPLGRQELLPWPHSRSISKWDMDACLRCDFPI